jgi:hypothetical protein
MRRRRKEDHKFHATKGYILRHRLKKGKMENVLVLIVLMEIFCMLAVSMSVS